MSQLLLPFLADVLDIEELLPQVEDLSSDASRTTHEVNSNIVTS